MTGDLNLMMEARNRRIMKDANVVCAEDIGQRAELGWFDTEFTMYGCVYWDPEKEKRYFKVSGNAEDIYSFIEKSLLNGIYPSDVMKVTERCSVPSGMKEHISKELKRKLAKQLRELYPREFFEQLQQLAECCEEDSAAEILWQEAQGLEGVFDGEKLRLFRQLVQYAYRSRTISAATFQKLTEWIKDEQKNMEDDVVSKDIFEKTIYGLAYEEEGRIRYMDNTQSAYIYENLYALEQKGVFTTPVFSHTFWYNYEYRLLDGIKDSKKYMRQVMDEKYWAKIKEIKKRSRSNFKEEIYNYIKEAKESLSEACVHTLLQYAQRWGF